MGAVKDTRVVRTWSWVLVHAWLLDGKMAQLLWKEWENSSKKLISLTAMWLSNLSLYPKDLKAGLEEIHSFMHSSVHHICQEVEEAQVSTNEQMDN